MNFKKRTILIAMILSIFTLLIGCGNSTMDKVYDDNSKIANSSDTFGLDKSEETIGTDIYKGNLELSGSGTVWRYDSTEDFDLKIPYTFLVKSSKAKIVLISPDNKVVNLVENTNKSDVNGEAALIVPIKKGVNRIKIVGYKKAKIDVELHTDKGSFKKISFEPVKEK